MILLLGRSGQLGKSLLDLFGSDQVLAPSKADIDLSDIDGISNSLDKFLLTKPIQCIFNAAAYTQVDRAETEPIQSNLVNSRAVEKLSQWATVKKIPLIHFSTDYVYPGQGNIPWRETDKTGSLNQYGRSKLAGDLAISSSEGQHLIFRTSWVYSEFGENFLKTMLRLGCQRTELSVVNDQIGAPTYARDLARWSFWCYQKAINFKKFPSGVYHLCPVGETSWYGFACEIFKRVRSKGLFLEQLEKHYPMDQEYESSQKNPLKIIRVDPITSAQYPHSVERPLNSRLELTKIKATFNIDLKHWHEGLAECLENYLRCKGNLI